MSDVDLTPDEERKAAEQRIWNDDAAFEIVTDLEAERQRVKAFNEQLERDAAQAEDEEL